MARDEKLEARFLASLPSRIALVQKQMMGGLVFMLNGNMLGGARRDKAGDAHFMLRVGKEAEEEALALPLTEPMIHGGRRMGGFVFLDEAADEATLGALMELALAYVKGLPAK